MLSVSSSKLSIPPIPLVPKISHQQQEAQKKETCKERLKKLDEKLKTLHPEDPELCRKLRNIFDGNRIDFKRAGITSEEFMNLDDETWEALSGFVQQQKKPVTEIYLPRHLNRTPYNLRTLLPNGKLQYLSIPKYGGLNLYVITAGITECAHVNVDFATILKDVRVPKGCVVHAKSVGHKNKIAVNHYKVKNNGHANFVKRSLVYGHSYANGTGRTDWRTKQTNLNCKAHFQPPIPGKELGAEENLIVCRQLSLDWIYARRAYLQAKKEKASFAAEGEVLLPVKQNIYRERYGSVEQIQQSVPASREQDYQNWVKRAPVRHVVRPLAQWGVFLDEQFEKMKAGDFCHFLIGSGSHAMAVELVLTEDGRKVVRFFDPNTTQTHVRTVEEAKKSLKKLPFFRMLLRGRREAKDYFGTSLDRVWFHAVPIKEDHPPLPSKNTSGRSLDIGPLTTQNVHSSLIYKMAKYGFAKELKKILQEILKDPIAHNKLEDLLVEKDADDVSPALYIALQEGRAGAVKAIVDAIFASNLSEERKVELLFAKGRINKASGLFMALQSGRVGAVKVMVEAILASNLSIERKMALLVAKDEDGVSGLFMPVLDGHPKTMKAVVEAILTSSVFSAEEKMTLLEEKCNGETILYMALSSDRKEVVKAIVGAIANSTLSLDRKMRLLVGENEKNSMPMLHWAIRNNHVEAVKAIVAVVLESSLSKDKKRKSLIGKDINGDSALSLATKYGCQEGENAFVETIGEYGWSATAKNTIVFGAGKKKRSYQFWR